MHYNRKRYIIILSVFGILLLAGIGLTVFFTIKRNNAIHRNDIIIKEVFSTLTYDESAYDRELDTIQNLKSLTFLSNSQMAKIDSRLSYLHLLNSNFTEYFKITGEALFYAQESKDYDSEAYIYLNMARYFFQINSINRACETIDKAFEHIKIEEIQNISIKCLGYQMYTEYHLAKKQYESAMKYNKFLSAAIKELTQENEILLFNRIAGVQKAKILFESGNKSAAYLIVNQLEKDPALIAPLENQVMVYDFAMPIYYLKCFECKDKYNYQMLIDSYKRYIDYCDTYYFTFKKTILAMHVIDMLPQSYSAEINKMAYDVAVSHEAMAIKYINSYTDELYEKLFISSENLRVKSLKKNATYVYLPRASFSFIIIITVCLIFGLFFNEHQNDGLTGLKNRHTLDLRIKALDNAEKPYSVIMMDIDNFKALNDTYTHAFGDQVLKTISKSLSRYENRNVKVYRYGGEELVVIIKKYDLQKVIHIAESIRSEINSMRWSEEGLIVTASFGIGTGNRRVLEIADRNMYHSKAKGKNFTTYEIEGKKYLAERRIDIRNDDLQEIEAKLK